MPEARSQRLPTSETRLLKMLSQGVPMMETLNELCNFIDAKSPGVIPTVLLPDGDGYLRLAAGPKVPGILNEVFDGMKMPRHASFQSMAGDEEKTEPVDDLTSDPSFASAVAFLASCTTAQVDLRLEVLFGSIDGTESNLQLEAEAVVLGVEPAANAGTLGGSAVLNKCHNLADLGFLRPPRAYERNEPN
jgi:hypothetical protein